MADGCQLQPPELPPLELFRLGLPQPHVRTFFLVPPHRWTAKFSVATARLVICRVIGNTRLLSLLPRRRAEHRIRRARR